MAPTAEISSSSHQMKEDQQEVNLSIWRQYPQNTWSFTNVDKLIPIHPIAKSPTPTTLPSAPQDFSSFSLPTKASTQTLNLQSFIETTHTDGLIIIQHGNILFENYRNGNAPNSKHILMSMTKSITGLLTGILQSQGKLSVDDPVTKYVPEVSGTIWKDVTIQSLIDMRSTAKYFDNTHAYRAATGWVPLKGDEAHTDLASFLAHFAPQEVVDDRFEYVSANTDLMGWVLERASGGKRFAELVEDLLWKPMGAEGDARVTVDEKGLARAAGGLCATLRDVARVASLFINDGRNPATGEEVVPSSWIQDIINNGSREAWSKGAFARLFAGQFDGMAYRNFCYADREEEVVMGVGIFGQQFVADWKNGIVVAKTGSQREPIDAALLRLTTAAFQEVRRILLEK